MNRFFLLTLVFVLPVFAASALIDDELNFYSKDTLFTIGVGLMVADIMANSPIDQSIQDWYQDDIRTEGTDDFSRFVKKFGSNKPLGILYASAFSLGFVFKETVVGEFLYDFSLYALRSTLVGLPVLVTGQVVLGADRPNQNTTSAWQPFHNDHGISGHAYMGAIPFITLANMSSVLPLKVIFYIMSTFTGISRINDNSHYPSQVLLGWLLAYTACNAITKTSLTFEADGTKISLGYKF
ncbi:MAG: hypothetical protein S4CHLAM20_12830 [Chlamydiia bacterium]|nr:hypothetical protein [Chlamydiia bacterium]